MANKTKLLLVLIFFLASFLRLWKITQVPVSLFGDELDVGYQAYSILKTGRDYQGNFMPLHFHSLAEWRTPLYLYSAVPTVAIFGISPLGVRLPAAIFGILGVWAIFLVVNEILNYAYGTSKTHIQALVAAFVMAISPWHIQYSRAGFEVTELLAFLLFGIYFFFRALRGKGKFLWLSTVFLCFTPWIYSTAKLFTPLLILFFFFAWRKEILKFPKPEIIRTIFAGLLVGLPIAYSTLFSGGTQRAAYISIFTDPTVTSNIGFDRTHDAIFRGQAVLGYKPTFWDRFFHNKVVSWTNVIFSNYFQSFSYPFLFINGDSNPRHSPPGVGEFYIVEVIGLVAGTIFFLTGKSKNKIKLFISFWLLAGALPSDITRDGGNHATRLILVLPPLVFLVSYGLVEIFKRLRNIWRYIFVFSYSLFLIVGMMFYLHNYYVHYPWDSEVWWHAGMKDAIQSVKAIDKSYDKVIISMAGEPAWIFFAAWYQYPPAAWQQSFPLYHNVKLDGFGEVSHIDKFYFGNFNVPGGSLYDLGKYIDDKTLYLAVAKEMPPNLIMDPERTPPDLKLLKAIPYPSGEPAYYLFTKK
jgi:4-amino-4-deoxy-L-arabinose transferase-like glycosyltransferase